MPLVNYKPEVYKQTAALDLEFVVLEPTWQEVGIKEWGKVMAHPIYSQTVEEMIDEGALIIQDVEEENVGLEGYSKASALRMIKDTFDEKLLKKWQQESDVPAYQTAIAKQLEKFKEATTEEDKPKAKASRSKSAKGA